jgi:hypothetical protein
MRGRSRVCASSWLGTYTTIAGITTAWPTSPCGPSTVYETDESRIKVVFLFVISCQIFLLFRKATTFTSKRLHPYLIRSNKHLLLAHGRTIQILSSIVSPKQWSPNLEGYGLVQLRCLLCIPVSHVTEQASQFDHFVQPPCTDRN